MALIGHSHAYVAAFNVVFGGQQNDVIGLTFGYYTIVYVDGQIQLSVIALLIIAI